MIDTLTSLRFVFALMAFGAHCYVIDSSFDTFPFKEGFVGVSFFFVLGGFIITGLSLFSCYCYGKPMNKLIKKYLNK